MDAAASPTKAIAPDQRATQSLLEVPAYRAAFEEWAEGLLKPYIQRVQALPSLRQKAGKEINDAVWRTISLNPFEVLILDSPLMQRLRRVRQLGVVHWVYPSAGHSRLEHCLGAVHQVQRLIDSLNRDAGEGKHLPVEWVQFLRLAALVHDIGHGLMSHVVENAFDSCGVTKSLRLQLAQALDVESCSLSEAAAYYILRSDIFKELVDVGRHKTGCQLPDEWQEQLGNAILGKSIYPRWPLLQELISGPFDADKLDYMSRDAQSAGIPNLTDIPRLIQKVRVAEVPASELPALIGQCVEAGFPSYFVQGILLSGGRTLDELMIARALLFDKVYRHQKTRALEAMFANAVGALLPLLDPDRVLTMPLEIGDDDFIALTRDTLASRLPVRAEARADPALGVAADIVARIRDRRLFVRAYAFSHTMPHDPFRDDARQRAGLDQLRRSFSPDPAERAELLRQIADTTEAIIRHAADLLPATEEGLALRHYIALDPFGRPTKMNEIARAYLITADRKLVQFREDAAESPAWSNAYLMTRDIGYVFAVAEYAPAVYLACEAVFRQRYGIRTPPSAMDYAKVDKRTVEAIRKRLAERSFYAGRPRELRPLPDRLGKADVAGILKAVASTLKPFQAYAAASQGGEAAMDEQRIHAWLRQFDTDEEIDCALRMLQGIRMLTRDEVRGAIEAFLRHNFGFEGCHVCRLGGPRDSSSVITYFAQDVAEDHGLNVVPLQQGLVQDERPILFVDDFLGTGRQAVTIIKDWLGEPYDDHLDEDHGPGLWSKLVEELKKRPIGFAFVYGTQAGKEHLMEEAQKSGLRATIHVDKDEALLPRAFGNSVQYRSQEAGERFRARCATIGQKLLESQYAGKWSAEKISGRALGYGNEAYLVAFPYNVPTATLTLLWSEGKVDGSDWLPLLPRRKKL